jgi:cell division protein FtsL
VKNISKWFWINIAMVLLLVVTSCVLICQRFNTRYSYNYLSHLQNISTDLNNQYLRLLLENRTYDITESLDPKSSTMIVPSANKILVLR